MDQAGTACALTGDAGLPGEVSARRFLTIKWYERKKVVGVNVDGTKVNNRIEAQEISAYCQYFEFLLPGSVDIGFRLYKNNGCGIHYA